MWQPGWEGSVGENGHTHTHMGESFCCSPETITALLIALYFFLKKVKTNKQTNNCELQIQSWFYWLIT